MPWYDEHIVYGEDTIRPYIKENGHEVHKIMNQIENGMIPQEVVQRHKDLNDFLDGIEDGDIESEIEVESTPGFEAPDFNVTHVEAAIDFTRDHEEMIATIREEQEALTEAMMDPPKQAYENVEELELSFFNVDADLTEEDGENVVHFNHEQ